MASRQIACKSIEVYHVTQKNLHGIQFYGFTVSGRTIKLKSVNWMESAIYYYDIEHETGLP